MLLAVDQCTLSVSLESFTINLEKTSMVVVTGNRIGLDPTVGFYHTVILYTNIVLQSEVGQSLGDFNGS